MMSSTSGFFGGSILSGSQLETERRGFFLCRFVSGHVTRFNCYNFIFL